MMLPWEPKADRCLENDESCGLPIRLVPRDPRLLFFGYFLRTTPPRLALRSINRRPSSCALGLRGECWLILSPPVATLCWRGPGVCLLGDSGSQKVSTSLVELWSFFPFQDLLLGGQCSQE